MLQAGRVAPGLILFCDRAVDVAVAEVQRIQEPEESVMTAPIAMKSRPLKITSANACATAPFTANAVPIPMPATMKPIWLIIE